MPVIFLIFLLTFSATLFGNANACEHNPPNRGCSLNDAGITWQSEYAAAFALAKEQDTIVFLAVNMDGERANDFAAKKLYHDKIIAMLSADTINLIASKYAHNKSGACARFGTIRCAEHQQVDIKARATIFNPKEDAAVIAPHHVFLDYEGNILLSVAYGIRPEELAWCFISAQRLAFPEREIEFTKGARAPKRLLMGEVERGADDSARPLSEGEMEKVIAKLNSARGFEQRATLIYTLLATDHPDAIKAVERELLSASVGGGRGGGMERLVKAKQDLIHRIGIYSPTSFWSALLPQLSDSNATTRLETAVALEQLAAADTLKELRKLFKKEKNADVRRAMIRAIGTAGAGDSSARKTLTSVAKSKKDQNLQLNAIFALGNQGDDKSVRKLFESILAENKVGPPQAMLLGIAFARNRALIDLLHRFPAEQGELSKELWECVVAARAVFEGGNLSLLSRPIERVCGGSIQRERFFGTEEDS